MDLRGISGIGGLPRLSWMVGITLGVERQKFWHRFIIRLTGLS